MKKKRKEKKKKKEKINKKLFSYNPPVKIVKNTTNKELQLIISQRSSGTQK